MAQEIMKGKFITFEGPEGSGKSTQSKLLYRYLKDKGYSVIWLREPGGTGVSEKLRKILLDSSHHSITPLAEMLLYMASRACVVEDVIRPALLKGQIVISDRFLDSTFAYQGFGLGLDIKAIKYIGRLVTGGLKPDLTIFLDLASEKGLKRCSRVKDRIEKRTLSYHRRVRRGYLKLAKLEPKRIKIVKVDDHKFVTHTKIRELVDKILKVSRDVI